MPLSLLRQTSSLSRRKLTRTTGFAGFHKTRERRGNPRRGLLFVIGRTCPFVNDMRGENVCACSFDRHFW
jgi:hypothetical protein